MLLRTLYFRTCTLDYMFDGSLQRFLLLSDYFLTPNYHFTKEIVLGD